MDKPGDPTSSTVTTDDDTGLVASGPATPSLVLRGAWEALGPRAVAV